MIGRKAAIALTGLLTLTAQVARAEQVRVGIQVSAPVGVDVRRAICTVLTVQGEELDRAAVNAIGHAAFSVVVAAQTSVLRYVCALPTFASVAGRMARQENGFFAKASFDRARIVSDVATTDEKVEMTFRLPPLALRKIDTPAGAFVRVVPPRGTFALRSGEKSLSLPETPEFNAIIAVPLGSRIKRVTVERSGAKVHTGVRLYPVQPEGRDTPRGDARFVFDPNVYKLGAVDVGKPNGARPLAQARTNLFSVTLNLVDYNPETQRLVTYDALGVKVEFATPGGCFLEKPVDQSDLPPPDAVDTALEQQHPSAAYSVLNADALKGGTCAKPFMAVVKGERLLILTHPSFAGAAHQLAIHKTALGISTRVITTSEVMEASGEPLTPVTIKAYLEQLSAEAQIKPRWLLILGDAEYVPTYYDIRNSVDKARNAGDIFYGQLESGDVTSLPSMAVGRIPVDVVNRDHPAGQARDVVAKIIDYEMNPPTEADYYAKATLAGYFRDDQPDNVADMHNYVEYVEREVVPALASGNLTLNRIFKAPDGSSPAKWNDGTALPASLSGAFNWGGGRAEILGAFAGGTPLFLHRGHGSWDLWGNPDFSVEDVAQVHVTNRRYPVVLSVNCASGIFDNETVNLPGNASHPGLYVPSPEKVFMAEAFLRKRDGALAVIGDTRTSQTTPNNQLTKGFFDAVVATADPVLGTVPSKRLGDLLNSAKGYVLLQNGGPGAVNVVRQQFVIFNLLGDPSVELRLTRPSDVSTPVAELKSANDGTGGINWRLHLKVDVRDPASGLPQAVSAFGPESPTVVVQDGYGTVLGRDLVNEGGEAWVDLGPEIPSTVTYTVAGTNLRPVKGTAIRSVD